MSETETAWACGIFEGEGCITTTRSRYGVVRPQISVVLTDPDVLERFAGILDSAGVWGSITGPYASNSGKKWEDGSDHKPRWKWTATGWKNLIVFAQIARPWIGVRRVERISELLTQKPPNVRRYTRKDWPGRLKCQRV